MEVLLLELKVFRSALQLSTRSAAECTARSVSGRL